MEVTLIPILQLAVVQCFLELAVFMYLKVQTVTSFIRALPLCPYLIRIPFSGIYN